MIGKEADRRRCGGDAAGTRQPGGEGSAEAKGGAGAPGPPSSPSEAGDARTGTPPASATAPETAAASAARPLEGVRVVVTRPAAQAEELCDAFAERGAVVERLPLLEVVGPADDGPLRDAVAALDRYRWLAVTSANAVRPVAHLLAEAGRPWPGDLRVAAVGRATAAALREHGVEPTLVTDSGGTELARRILRHDGDLSGGRVLLPQAADARPELAGALRDADAEVDAVTAYAKRLPPAARERAEELFHPTATLGWVTFTSPRIARAFAALIDDLAGDEGGWEHRRLSLLAASIGPTTSTALRELGVEPAAEAATPGDAELADAVVTTVADRAHHRP